MAIVIARIVINVMIEARYSEPHHALIRMNFPNSKMITLAAIGMHFRRNEQHAQSCVSAIRSILIS
jgi:hypothetical protein